MVSGLIHVLLDSSRRDQESAEYKKKYLLMVFF